MFLLGFILPGPVCASWTWLALSFPHVWEVFNYYLFKYFLRSHSHVRLFVTPWTVAHQAPLSMEFSRQEYWSGLPLGCLYFFSIFCSAAVIYTILSSRSFICSSASVILLLISSRVLFTSVYLFFSTSGSLVIISCIFSTFASILFLRSWTIFTVIVLNSFSGRFPVSTLFSCFSGLLSCPFI